MKKFFIIFLVIALVFSSACVTTGERGRTGAKGDKGDKGDNGSVLYINCGENQCIMNQTPNQTAGQDGADGYTPVKGVDYFDGINGTNGTNGQDGADGYTPIFGVDYFNGSAGEKGEKGDDGYTPIFGVDYFNGQDGADGEDGYTPIKGVDYFDGAKGDKGDTGDTGAPGQNATIENAYPVGSIYISTVSTNPNTLFGFGTWNAFGTGRVLIGIDSGDTKFDSVEETGGAETASISAHTGGAVGAIAQTATANVKGGTSSSVSAAAQTHTHPAPSFTQPSAHTDISIMNPYIVVYMWERTA